MQPQGRAREAHRQHPVEHTTASIAACDAADLLETSNIPVAGRAVVTTNTDTAPPPTPPADAQQADESPGWLGWLCCCFGGGEEGPALCQTMRASYGTSSAHSRHGCGGGASPSAVADCRRRGDSFRSTAAVSEKTNFVEALHPSGQAGQAGAGAAPCRAVTCPSMVGDSCVTFVLPPLHGEEYWCGGSFCRSFGVVGASCDLPDTLGACSSLAATPPVSASFPPPSPHQTWCVPRHPGGAPLTIVFDLDETLAHKRGGPLTVRPYARELLHFLASIPHCEVVVWTAGLRHYAQQIVAAVDDSGVIRHCVYRHRKWFPRNAKDRCVKDLSLTGRDPRRVLLIDNSPECVCLNASNSIVCRDFCGNSSDTTLKCLMEVIAQLARTHASVPDFLKHHPDMKPLEVRDSKGAAFMCYFLDETRWGGPGLDGEDTLRKRGVRP